MIQDLVERHPKLKPLLDEHLADNDELLDHDFFGDVVRWAESEQDGSTELSAVLADLDRYWVEGDEDVRNVIGVSFIEPLGSQPQILMAMGPVLRATPIWGWMVRSYGY